MDCSSNYTQNGKKRFDYLGIVTIFEIVYSLIFIFKTSFTINGERYFCLFDDAMISMRYAKNFVLGHGLVWNVGEWIEGFTNPLWTLYMAFIHLTGAPISKTSLLIQLTELMFLTGNIYYVKKMVESIPGTTRLTSVITVLLTATYYPLINWSLQGMEVGPLTMLVSAVVYLCVKQLNKQHFQLSIYILLSVMLLIRIDMAVFFCSITGYLAFLDRKNRLKHIMIGLGLFFCTIVSLTIVRYLYYGDILPNTYYLKMGGYPTSLRILRGMLVFLRFSAWLNWFLVLLVIYVLLKRDRYTMLLTMSIIPQILYSIYIGGDAWERWTGCNRFICVVMPCFFVLFALSICRIITSDTLKSLKLMKKRECYFVLKLSTIALSILQINMFHGPEALAKCLFLKPPVYVNNNHDAVLAAKLLEKKSDRSTRIAVVMAGALPYFCDRYMIDMLGKCDKVIAREPMKMVEDSWLLNRLFFPGHMKWNYYHSIIECKADIITELWWKSDEASGLLKEFKLYEVGNYRMMVNSRFAL